MKVGIFSGTFDPIHIGHIETCLVARDVCNLEKVVLLIEQHLPRKLAATDVSHRVAMAQIAAKKYKWLSVIPSPSAATTVQNTLPFLRKSFPGAELTYIVGSDLFLHLPTWPNYEKLLNEMTLCVVLRNSSEEAVVNALVVRLKKAQKELQAKVLPPVWSPVSSAVVRQELRKIRTSEYLDTSVLEYATTQQIYFS